MEENIEDELRKRFWQRWGCLLLTLVFLALISLCPALAEEHPIGAFAEILLARTVFVIVPFLCFAAAYWAKEKIEEITDYRWLGIVAGFMLFCLLVLGSFWVGKKIPGVNWRIDEMVDE